MTRAISERDAAPVALLEGRFASGERSAVRRAEDLQPPDEARAEQGGFSGSCQNASLADWIQLIQMGRRDAVIVVRAPGNREGRLWCKAGDIVDARWNHFTGEDAVHHILAFESGDVAVEFTTFERPRTIHTPTPGLLLEAAYRRDTRVSETRSTRPYEAPRDPGGAAATSMAPTVTGPPSLPPAPGRGTKVRALFWAAAAATATMAFWLSWRAGANPPAAASGAPVTAAAPEEGFAVRIDAKPEDAEIRLDGQLVATKALATRVAHDGRLHEIVVSARGYVPELVTFRDRALTEQIALERLPPTAAEPPPVHLEDVVSIGARRAQPTHRAPAPTADAKNAAPPTTPTAAPTATTALKAKIQTIDERQPRIQAIDEGRPRIESIE
jgi:hypothetical protein